MPRQRLGTAGEEQVSRGKRKREVANRMKRVDFSAVEEARNRRLEALENDNYAAEQEALLLEGEEEYNPGIESEDEMAGRKRNSRPRKRKQRRRQRGQKDSRLDGLKTGIEKWNKPTQLAVEEENLSARPKSMVSLLQMVVSPSSRPPRYFCSTCGYSAPYTCTRCFTRFCSVRCNLVHQETRCLKFTV
ncbi:SWR1 complex subunit 6 [Gracilariopsis chorda]|uniref:SWR1 complex subunit 6 n=1 Tax=Gracilariopsis chorda TaxID=448386 RepID=A0A2V3IYR2_9FLOR|nr:SWR1 complex subunit 6 [Gracilariopsis chorda]|eukprot:PXF47292.1 SWR1 complex subunit 6 [Gracilariopsis chorda]